MSLYLVESNQLVSDFLPEVELQQEVQVTGVIKETIFQNFEVYSRKIELLENLAINLKVILEEYDDIQEPEFAISEIQKLVKDLA